MPDVYQLQINGYSHAIAGSITLALQHAAETLQPGGLAARAWGGEGEYPELREMGTAGSDLQRIRHAAMQQWEDVQITQHDTEARPGNFTGKVSFDLATLPDPAFAVQSALWNFADGEQPVGAAADDLFKNFRALLNRERDRMNNDEALVQKLRTADVAMGGEVLIPASGHPGVILDELPMAVTRRFEEVAAYAYKEVQTLEAAAPALR